MPVNFLLNEDECYSKARDLSSSFWISMSNEKEVDEHGASVAYSSMFAKSFAVRRVCVPEVLKVHPRRLFQDWAKAMFATSDSTVTEVVARKHWHTGRDFLKPILKAIFFGTWAWAPARGSMSSITRCSRQSWATHAWSSTARGTSSCRSWPTPA